MAERDPRQECGCPVIEACVHIDGLTLWLADNSERSGLPTGPGHYVSNEWVVYGPGVAKQCRYPECLNHLVMADVRGDMFPTLSAAQAEFARRAELLRAGGGDG